METQANAPANGDGLETIADRRATLVAAILPDAMEAFWGVIAARTNAPTGDVDPISLTRFKNAAATVVRTWLDANLPNMIPLGRSAASVPSFRHNCDGADCATCAEPAPGERAFIVEVDPLLSVRVYASDEDEARERACAQLANDDFANVATCSEIDSNVQCVRAEDEE